MKDSDNMKENNFEFINYINSNGLYYHDNTIEEFLLSLKLNNIIFLNGIPGLDKTKFIRCYCDYYIKNSNLNETITSTSKIGKTQTNKGFAVKRDDLIKIIPKTSYENHCEFYVDNIKVNARLNILPRLFFKPAENEEFYKYLDKSKKNGIENVTYNILLNKSNDTYYKIYDGRIIVSKYDSEIKDFIDHATNNKNFKYFLIFNKINDDNISQLLFNKEELPDNVYIFYCGFLKDKSNIINDTCIIDFKSLSPIDYLQNNTHNINFKDIDFLIKNENIYVDDINSIKKILLKITLNNKENLYSVLLNQLDKLYYILSKENIYLTNNNIKYILNFMILSWKYEREPNIFKNWKKYFDLQIIQRVLPLISNQDISIELLTNLLKFCEEEYFYNRTYNAISSMIE